MTDAHRVGRAEKHPGCYQTESEQQGLTQGDRGNLRTPTVLPFGREDPLGSNKLHLSLEPLLESF